MGSKHASQITEAFLRKIGTTPKVVITDGLQSYNQPIASNRIKHVAKVGFANKENNNRIERLHGPKSIQKLPNSKSKPNGGGIYALCDNYGSYYVGLITTSIRSRIRSHDRSKRHMGKWDRLSWYQIPEVKNVKDI
ncbi:MAG: hypothetical protein ACRD5H_13570 [Nitrososphaerales archaeon]